MSRRTIFGLALVMIFLVWIVDAAIDAVFFYDETFLEISFLAVPPIEVYWRISVAVSLLAFAAFLGRSQARAQVAHTALRESEERYRAFFELDPDGVVILDPDTAQILEFNDQACRQLGYSREEFGRLAVPDIEAIETLEETLARISRIRREGQGSFETRQRTKEGEIRDVQVKVRIIEVGGRKAYFCVWIDITEQVAAEDALREGEARLRSVLDTSPFPVVIVDLDDDQVFYWSRSAMGLFGHTAPTAAEWYQLAYPDPAYQQEVLAKWKPALERAKETHQTVNTGEYEVTCSDGSIKICEIYATFLSENLIVTFHDVTQRKELERALRDSRDRLRGLTGEMERVREEERARLARELHDEVGQALSALKMDLDLMEQKNPGGRAEYTALLSSMIEVAQDSVDRVNRMASELRSPILEVLGLKDAVESEVWEYRERRGLNVSLEMGIDDLDRSPSRDLAIFRIFQGALANAREHAQAGQIEISLRVEGSTVALEVLDNGIGISEKQLWNQGSYGLIGMRERAGRIGGTVEITRRPEGGTRVRAMIPIAIS